MHGRNLKPNLFTDITMPAKLSVAQIVARYLKFEDITFYSLSVYHYNYDKQNCIITGWA